ARFQRHDDGEITLSGFNYFRETYRGLGKSKDILSDENSDILLPLEPMGIHLEFTAGEGPVIHNPVRDSSGVSALKEVDGDSLRYVGDAIRLAQQALQAQPCPVPLIGFAGAPFTLASYMIEGGSSRNYIHTKGMMYSDPTAWHALMKKLAHVVTEYLRDAGLMLYLEELGFHLVGYGCTTCIGNSGPLPEPVARAVTEGELVAAAVLSGNRNFEGRVHPQVRANYLASPPLVVAYALAGTMDIDLTTEPIGKDQEGAEVYLKDLWPTQAQVNAAVSKSVTADKFKEQYASVFTGNDQWNQIAGAGGETYRWESSSTYIHEPPFLTRMGKDVPPIEPITGARVLVMLGDSVTTDHISPAGAIKPDSPAGRYLQERGVQPADFNSYGSRRGHDHVMTRGTFANIRLRNRLAPDTEGGVTIHLPTGEQMSIFDAAERYGADGTPLVVLAGKEYGTGSSRDWAAKGTLLLGVRVVIAESYERIHRSNLIGMCVLPLQFRSGETRESLGITGQEVFDFVDLSDDLKPRQNMEVRLTDPQTGASRSITLVSRIDSPVEVDYYRHGGILPCVLRKLLSE
ncbi:MAG: hypothetical protein IID39_10165, partial [Planctomycetes bacterium]|nr:hypothetical protein [Planctomycetota bacterium]